MEIATQHPKRQRVGSGHHMEERFLLDRVTLQRGHISPRHAQLSALIEPHLTNPAPALTDFAAMPAGKTFDCVIRKFLCTTPPLPSMYPDNRQLL